MTKTKASRDVQKYYNIMVTGKVLDIGFRTLIEDIARLHDLKGYAFNDLDGSVKMVCSGDISVIDEFLDEVRFRGSQKGAGIEDIEKEEITQRIFLPQRFLRLYTDEFADIGRKLDVGVEVLKSIKGDTSALVIEMRDHNKEQRGFNQEMREHNKRLEKILEKLAEK
ncbi:MAG: acylphosphatase [Candidatus Methanoperedens sp.]|nr:acylphosphatase [Candidatus Methanoperedens sp.]